MVVVVFLWWYDGVFVVFLCSCGVFVCFFCQGPTFVALRSYAKSVDNAGVNRCLV